MEIALFCTHDSYKTIIGILERKGFVISDKAEIAVVEKGLELPTDVISIVFEITRLNKLIDFLDLIIIKKDSIRDAIIGKKDDKYEIISFENVKCFEADGNDVFCFTANEKFNIKNKLYELEEKLKERGFIRVSKSTIVNIMAIKEIIPWFDSRFILKLKDNIQLEVTKKYCRNFKDFIGF